MFSPRNRSESGRWWLVVLGLATLFGLLQVTQNFLILQLNFRSFSWVALFCRSTFDWYIWAALTPIMYQLTRLAPFESGRWRFSLFIHLPVCALFCFLIVATGVVIIQLKPLEEPAYYVDPDHMFRTVFTMHFIIYVFIYWAIIGTCQALEFHRKWQERELRASQLTAQLAQAQLQMLKMQLHPHFLFNTLNAISALIHKDVAVADRMIARLGELLRRTLETRVEKEVPLWREMDFVRPYLEIEQARLGPRLQVSLKIEPDAMDAMVPNFVLQPLVENAILHGIVPKTGAGKIEIKAIVQANKLVLQVIDDGPGLPLGPVKERIGLANTRARLQHMYPHAHAFSVANVQSRGCVAIIEVPYREYIPCLEDTPIPSPHSLVSVS